MSKHAVNPRPTPNDGFLRIRGARQNNLKGIDLDLPLGALIAVTGVSGSGKSSLAFETLYAEGQRRYVESFSAYARQFLDRMDKPRVDSLEAVPPSIAIDQSNPVKNSRSTVGTMTELTDYVKVLFSKLAQLYCSGCGKKVERDTASSVFEKLVTEHRDRAAFITFPLGLSPRVDRAEVERSLRQLGLTRLLVRGEPREISPDLLSGKMLSVFVDRVVLKPEARERVVGSLEQAFRFGKGRLSAHVPDEIKFSEGRHCAACDLHYADPVPSLFSFNNPLGACESCRGFGRTIGVDMDLVIPDPSRSLQAGAVKPWTTASFKDGQEDLAAFCQRRRIPWTTPWKDLTAEHRQWVVDGDKSFYGIEGFFKWLESRTYKMHIRVLLSRYRSYKRCAACGGTRFKPQTLIYRLGEKTIADLYALSIGSALDFFASLETKPGDRVSELLYGEIVSRLGYLRDVGLSYLTLDRQSRTLSGGEVQRVDLTTALGSSLVNTLYVLDEPSVGLHPRDTSRLMDILKRLRDNHNTIVVVEHDPEVIRRADRVVDLGPGAGERGGELLFFGTPAEMAAASSSLTGKYLSGRARVPLHTKRRPARPGKNGVIRVRGARDNNLKDLDVDIPLGLFVCLTGVSGSGKSTLVDVIQREYRNTSCCVGAPPPTRWADGSVRNLVLVDQSAISRTPRSNALTYLKAYDPIRKLFAGTKAARARGLEARAFSFNVDGGRCPVCSGDGYEKIEMQFLSDVYVRCESCQGSRFKNEVLDVRYREKNIKDVLDLTVNEAVVFFADREAIVRSLATLREVGLGYLRLGQPVSTLSGGEAQRLKLAAHLSQAETEGTLFVLDEPTTGLHFDDVRVLLEALERLLTRGASLLVVEHNMDVIKNADWIVDLGPEGGDGGGRVVVAGTPEQVAACKGSHTGRHLGPYLEASPFRLQPEPLALPEISNGCVRIEGARQHNLRNVSVDIPRDKLVVLTGLSGSGKSTLAFDILFAEGQRRFIESLSPYARQYIQVLDRPEVDSVSGIPPTVAIEQRLTQGSHNSTVATVTEIYHYLRLLYAKVGVQHCVDCHVPITAQSEDQIAADIALRFAGERIELLAPLVRARKGHHTEVFARARKAGFDWLRIDGKRVRTRDAKPLRRYVEHDVEAVVATLEPSRHLSAEERDAVRRALELGRGAVIACRALSATALEQEAPDRHYYSLARACRRCDRSYEEPDPRLFSFNSRYGACPACSGAGSHWRFTEALVVPDARRSLEDGAIVPLAHPLLRNRVAADRMKRAAARLSIDPTRPFLNLSPLQRESLLHGAGALSPTRRRRRRDAAAKLEGVLPLLERLYAEATGELSSFLSEFREETRCVDCEGARLKPEARAVRIRDKAIHEVTDMVPEDVLAFLETARFEGREAVIAEALLDEIQARLRFLSEVGLSYLQLSRPNDTLSGGEAQRIRLAAQLGSNLRGVCYVLDEPTIGLHVRDNRMLLRTLTALKDRGNSVVIVEHDEETIRSADYIVDLGPGGGTEGGQVVATGTPAEIEANPLSVTGRCLRRLEKPAAVSSRPLEGCRFVVVSGAREHNLLNLTVKFPVGRLTVVTGVSGSGKSTLVKDTLYRGIRKRISGVSGRAGAHDEIRGAELLTRVLEVDQTPIGKTPRSIPASYVGFFDDVRRLFSQTVDARALGYGPGRFSFNVKAGRCEACAGQGRIRMEMSFLPDVYVHCETCAGRRFTEDTLAVTYRGKNISQVLEMTLAEAQELFRPVEPIYRPLSLLNDVGLSYLTLGQPSNTLSGGEAQRIKLAYELAKPSRGQTLYVLDEPTTGLHLADVQKLLSVLSSLVERGNTVVVVEHNVYVMAAADCLVDLGPEGGKGGGRLVAWGPPADLVRGKVDTHTVRSLREHLSC